MEVEEIVKAMVVEQIGTDGGGLELLSDTKLQTIGMDSINFIKLIVEIECEFDIEYPEDKLLISESGTVRQIVAIVESCLYNA